MLRRVEKRRTHNRVRPVSSSVTRKFEIFRPRCYEEVGIKMISNLRNLPMEHTIWVLSCNHFHGLPAGSVAWALFYSAVKSSDQGLLRLWQNCDYSPASSKESLLITAATPALGYPLGQPGERLNLLYFYAKCSIGFRHRLVQTCR